MGASNCSAELTTVIVAVISSCSSSNCSLDIKATAFISSKGFFTMVTPLCFVKPSVLYCLNE